MIVVVFNLENIFITSQITKEKTEDNEKLFQFENLQYDFLKHLQTIQKDWDPQSTKYLELFKEINNLQKKDTENIEKISNSKIVNMLLEKLKEHLNSNVYKAFQSNNLSKLFFTKQQIFKCRFSFWDTKQSSFFKIIFIR